VALSLSVIYIQSIGSGIAVFSGLFPIANIYDISIALSSLVPVKPGEAQPPHRLTKKEKSQLSLSDELRQILVGLLLGDLYAQKPKGGVNVLLRFTQGIIHMDYLLHLYDLFKTLSTQAPKINQMKAHKVTGKSYSSIRFNSYSLPCFNELYELFYVDGKKVVPSNIGELLTPLSLAYWIADDGGFNNRDRAIVISTQSFRLQEVNLLNSE